MIAETPAPAAPLAVHHPLRGALLLTLAVLVLACMDAATKQLTAHYNVPLVVAVRYVVHALIMVIALTPRQGRQLVRTRRTGLVLARAASLTVASLFMGLALQRMPVAETTAINFLSPMVVVLLAGPFLGERVGWVSWAAGLTGFAGVVLIARPGGGLDAGGIVFALCAAAANTVYQILSRLLAGTERAATLMFYTALVGAIVFGAMLPWFWYGERPGIGTLLVFASVGATAALGHYLFTLSYRDAPASTLAPLNYLQLLWAGLLGWLVFGHVPDAVSFIGLGVVAASGALIAVAARPRRALSRNPNAS